MDMPRKGGNRQGKTSHGETKKQGPVTTLGTPRDDGLLGRAGNGRKKVDPRIPGVDGKKNHKKKGRTKWD